MSAVKYPHIRVQLIGNDGNAFSLLAAVERALKRAEVPRKEVLKFREEATSGDYNHLLATAIKWVEVE